MHHKTREKHRNAIQGALDTMLLQNGITSSYTLTGAVADTVMDAIEAAEPKKDTGIAKVLGVEDKDSK